MNTEEIILSLEKEALDEWANGNPTGFNMHLAEDGTYIDDIGAQNRLEGRDTILKYSKSLEEMLQKHRYEVVNQKVQIYGDCAVVSYWYHPTTLDDKPSTKWRATQVYAKPDGEWKVVHGHWTMLKEDQ